MLKLFCPDFYIEHFNNLNIDQLKEKGIKLLLCDIDNTLVPHDVSHPDETVIKFIEKLKNADITVVLVSNNVEDRVSTFAKPLNLNFYPFAKKPLPFTYYKVLKDYHLSKSEIAVLGDQLLTDMLGGNVAGFYTILTKQVVVRDLKWTKINRVFENMVYKLLERKNLLKRGNYSHEEM